MTNELLHQLFPTAHISSSAESTPRVYSIPYNDQWLHIPKADLTSREQALLMQLIDNDTTAPANTSPWLDFLQQADQPIPTTHTTVRMIQLHLDFRGETLDQAYCQQSIQNLFNGVLDVFYYTANHCLFIQSNTTSDFHPTEWRGILQTLEEDYSVKLTAYIGRFWPTNSNLRDLLQEELAIFQSQRRIASNNLLDLSSIGVAYYTTTSRQQSSVLQELQTALTDNQEWIDVIQALWDNQRNLSEAAKSLYIHRNTLQYRMDKFTETTGLSLKETNDLFLAYLLTI